MTNTAYGLTWEQVCREVLRAYKSSASSTDGKFVTHHNVGCPPTDEISHCRVSSADGECQIFITCPNVGSPVVTVCPLLMRNVRYSETHHNLRCHDSDTMRR